MKVIHDLCCWKHGQGMLSLCLPCFSTFFFVFCPTDNMHQKGRIRQKIIAVCELKVELDMAGQFVAD